jgi:hypothetical protein
MQDELEQNYVFLRFATADFEQALRSLAMIKRYRREDIVSVLIRDAVVAYGRPFSINRGVLASKSRLRLPDAFVAMSFRNLHDRSITLRNKVFAHTDLGAVKPQLSRFGTKPNHLYPVRLTPISFVDLKAHAKLLPALVRQVHERTVQEIEQIERDHLDSR